MKITARLEFATSGNENPKDSRPPVFDGLAARILAQGAGPLAPETARPPRASDRHPNCPVGRRPFQKDG
eukprot:7030850-Pyramimonas_sp.AAC.1